MSPECLGLFSRYPRREAPLVVTCTSMFGVAALTAIFMVLVKAEREPHTVVLNPKWRASFLDATWNFKTYLQACKVTEPEYYGNVEYVDLYYIFDAGISEDDMFIVDDRFLETGDYSRCARCVSV